MASPSRSPGSNRRGRSKRSRASGSTTCCRKAASSTAWMRRSMRWRERRKIQHPELFIVMPGLVPGMTDGFTERRRRLYCRHDLARIENILRVECLLQRPHGIDGLGTELGLEVLLLALPDAVLASAGAAHRLRALDQAMHELLATRHLVGIVEVA